MINTQTSTTTTTVMDPTSNSPTRLLPPYIKRHGHKRSSAISGDFDINNGMSIFITNNNNNNSNALSKSVPTNDVSPIQLYSNDTTTATHDNDNDENKTTTPPLRQSANLTIQSPMIIIENSTSNSSSSNFNYDSPLKSSPYTINSPINNNNSNNYHHHNNNNNNKKTRFFMTDETKFDKFSDIPNALIDLDDIITGQQPVIKHKRTESAPADFSGFNSSSNIERFLTSPVRNEVVVEEDEESDNGSISSHLLSKQKKKSQNISNDDDFISASSSLNSILSNGGNNNNNNGPKNSSTNSLQSITQLQQENKTPSISSLRGKAARYQNYYNNQQKVGNVKPNGGGALKKSIEFKNVTTSRSSSNSPTRSIPNSITISNSANTNGGGGFKFDSVVYDMPENLLSDYYNEIPKLNPPSRSSSPLKNELLNNHHHKNHHKHERSKSLQSSPESSNRNSKSNTNTVQQQQQQNITMKNKPISKSHKKSNSLFNSISKIHLRMNSSSSSSSPVKNSPYHNNNNITDRHHHHRKSSSMISKTTNEDLIYYQRPKSSTTTSNSSMMDNTLTSYNFDTTLTNIGEPGPMIFKPVPDPDTSTMNNNNNNDVISDKFNSIINNDNNLIKASAKEEDKKVKHRWWFRKSTK